MEILSVLRMFFFSISFVLCWTSCSSQAESVKQCDSSRLSHFDNDSIEYQIVLLSCDTCKPISTIGYRVMMSLSESDSIGLIGIDKNCWMDLLKSERSDWASNIILYYLYQKDAALLAGRSGKEKWRLAQKQADLDYWNNFFNK